MQVPQGCATFWWSMFAAQRCDVHGFLEKESEDFLGRESSFLLGRESARFVDGESKGFVDEF